MKTELSRSVCFYFANLVTWFFLFELFSSTVADFFPFHIYAFRFVYPNESKNNVLYAKIKARNNRPFVVCITTCLKWTLLDKSVRRYVRTCYNNRMFIVFIYAKPHVFLWAFWWASSSWKIDRFVISFVCH